MKGLRTQESEKFNRFFALIQTEAEKNGCVFFADAGDGDDFETPEMEGEIMMGWLIPRDRSREFEPLWHEDAVNDSWSDFYKWAAWRKTDEGSIVVVFEE